MKVGRGNRTRPAGAPQGETKTGIPPERPVHAADAQPETDHAAGGFPVVGIGASAGGLAAFEAFFSGMPAIGDPGMAFVLVQHLAPDHKSL
ncbi:MAG: chemotaxis protein CheB, partial [Desulfobacterales bacterium]|nr:chemotaxis protein CheB [Desulfobacterales bacterium]